MIIERPYLKGRLSSLLRTSRWVLVYGRRKTGKSFLIKNFIKYDEFFFVKRDRTILDIRGNQHSYETFKEVLKRSLKGEKTLVVDEFHRLGQDFLDFLHSLGKQGRLVLISSTLSLSKKMLNSKSPLLGLFAELVVPLISLEDSLKATSKAIKSKKKALEFALLMREPMLAYDVDAEESPKAAFVSALSSHLLSVPSLVGEIFMEEERGLSSVYEGILRAVALGKVTTGQISSYLFSRKLIAKDDPSLVQQYLKNLVEIGVLKKVEVFSKRRFIYKHSSPIVRLYYYADERYNISELSSPEPTLERVVEELLPRIVEDNVREFLASKMGLRESVYEASDFDVDALLLRFKKPEVAVEVKWKDRVAKKDIEKAEATLSRFKVKHRFLLVPDASKVKEKTSLEILDAYAFL